MNTEINLALLPGLPGLWKQSLSVAVSYRNKSLKKAYILKHKSFSV